MNALLDQKKTDDVWLGFGDIRHLRVQPLVTEILESARPATVGKGDLFIHSALKIVLIKAIMDGHFRAVYATLGELLGIDSTSVETLHDGGDTPKKPLAKAVGK